MPSAGPARDDIRAYDAAERAKGKDGKPVRCGKCKSTKWDENYRKSLENGEKDAEKVPDVTVQDVIQTMDMPVIPAEVFEFAEKVKSSAERLSGGPRLCRHRVTNCEICSK